MGPWGSMAEGIWGLVAALEPQGRAVGSCRSGRASGEETWSLAEVEPQGWSLLVASSGTVGLGAAVEPKIVAKTLQKHNSILTEHIP